MNTWILAVPPLVVLFASVVILSLCARIDREAGILAGDVADLDRLVAASGALERRLGRLEESGRDLTSRGDR